MPTFASPTPLTERIREAKRTLDQVRRDGHQPIIEAAERVFHGLADRLPPGLPLSETDPHLDAQLRVTMK